MNGHTLEKARKIQNVKQEVLAEAMGISQSAYSKLINSDRLPDNFNLDVFADALNVNKDWINSLEERISLVQNIEQNDGFAFVMNNYNSPDKEIVSELNNIIQTQNSLINQLKIMIKKIENN